MEISNQYLSDQPVSNPNTEDKLGYSLFSKAIANAINAIPMGKNAVVAIHGKWGSGKTSAINFVKHYLRELAETEKPVIVDFNPWWLSGEEQLLRGFFHELKAAFGEKGSFGEFAGVLSEFFIGLSQVTDVKPVGIIGNLFGKASNSRKSLKNLKSEIEKKLLSINKKIVIFIDDLDRLTPEETLQVFKVIKAIGDFPNVIYVLSFDRKVVLNNISNIHDDFADNYLEKIVQMQFELPKPDPEGLLELFFPELNRIIGNLPQEKFDSRKWQNSFYYLHTLLETPRDIKRLCNSLSVIYPMVTDEVNAVDFIILEFLKIFRPLLYGIIRDNLKEFVGSASNSTLSPSWKKFHENWFDQLDYSDKSNLIEVVKEIFPKASAVWGNTYYNSLNEWEIESRICHPDKAEIYFRLVTNPDQISNKEWENFIQKASAGEDLSKVFLEYSNIKTRKGGTRIKELLVQIWGHSEKLSPDVATKIAYGLIDVGDFILKPEDKWPGFYQVGSETALHVAIYKCLKRNEGKRKENVKKAISKAKSVFTPMSTLTSLNKKEEIVFSDTELKKYQKILYERTKKYIQEDGLARLDQAPFIFGALAQWGYSAEIKKWMENLLSSVKETFRFLKLFVRESHSQTIGSAAISTHRELQQKWLEPYVDLGKIADIVKRNIDSDELDDSEKKAGELFLENGSWH